MEQELLNNVEVQIPAEQTQTVLSTDKPFIQANTIPCTLEEVRDNHIIPVFIKDNEPVISHHDFIEATLEVVETVYVSESILKPIIRLSHPIKGRVPDARDKPAKELLEHEKTLYYERMAFIIEIPSVCDEIDGNRLSLTVGGVKAYNLDNLYNRKGADEHFKIFVGFKNTVCTNLCVWSDGFIGDLKVKSLGQLKGCIRSLIDNYNAVYQIHEMQRLVDYSITDQQFALLLGRCRMYNHLPYPMKQEITPLLLSDTQLSSVVKDYFRDGSFCKDDDGNINLWRVYNLLTGSNKSSYIDTFLDRSVNAYSFVETLRWCLDKKKQNWFLN
jgi:hypothetical protein